MITVNVINNLMSSDFCNTMIIINYFIIRFMWSEMRISKVITLSGLHSLIKPENFTFTLKNLFEFVMFKRVIPDIVFLMLLIVD